MADSRMSQLLPTIRCGTCNADVAYRDLGTHVCEEAPPMPDFRKAARSAGKSSPGSPGGQMYRESPPGPANGGGFSRGQGGRSEAREPKSSAAFLKKYNQIGDDDKSMQDDETDDDYDGARGNYRAAPRRHGSRRPSIESGAGSDARYGSQTSSPEGSRRGYVEQGYDAPQYQRNSRDSQRSGGDGADYDRARGGRAGGLSGTNRYSRSTTSSNEAAPYRGRDRMIVNDRPDVYAYGSRTPSRSRFPSNTSPSTPAYGGRERSLGNDRQPSRADGGYSRAPSQRGGGGDDRLPTGRQNRDGGARARRPSNSDDGRQETEYSYSSSKAPRDRDEFSDYSRAGSDGRRRGPRSRDDYQPEDRNRALPGAAADRPRRPGDRTTGEAPPFPDQADQRYRPARLGRKSSDYDARDDPDSRSYSMTPPSSERRSQDDEGRYPSAQESDVTEQPPEPQDPAPAPAPAASTGGLNFFRNFFSSVSTPAAASPSSAPTSPPPATASPSPPAQSLTALQEPPKPRAGDERMSDLQSKLDSMKIQTAKLLLPSRDRNAYSSSALRGKCGSCNRGIYQGEAAYEAIGKVFHTSCFRCDECDVPLDERSGFVESDGRILCEGRCAPAAGAASESAARVEDRYPDRIMRELPSIRNASQQASDRSDLKKQKPLPVCYTCKEPIAGEQMYAFRRPYHPEHLLCKNCEKPIDPDVGHIEHEGQVYCPADFAQLFLPKCGMCNNPIDGQAVCALDKKWHPECFGCQICKKPFPDKSFYVLDDMPFCRRHYHERNNSICHECNQPIEGPCAQIQQEEAYGGGINRYHPPCFACNVCRVPLADVYYSFKGAQYCERHIMEIQRKKNIRVERRRTQFSMLPPSGY